MDIFFIKIGHDTKNAVDRVGSLCYTITIERQGTERLEKWRAKK
jgi:hypothetical protein